MQHIKAVLFDFGGTLYDYSCLVPGDQESLLALAGWLELEAAPEALTGAYQRALRGVFQDYLARPYYLHREMFETAARRACATFGVEPDAELLQRHRALQWQLQARDFKLRRGVVSTLEELRDRGLVLGMVSNIDHDHLQHLIDVAGLRQHFDWLLSSEAAGSCKPDERIFHQALERAGCEPHEALFVGDSLSQDIAGANGAGLESVHLWHRPQRTPPAGDHEPRHRIATIPELLDLVAGKRR